jgi:fatty acid desaturase
VKGKHYSRHTAGLRADLGQAIPRDRLRALHAKTAWRHFAIAARQFVLLAACTWALVRVDHPAVWLPLAVVQGFTVFDFTILLHEVVHHVVFERPRPRADRLLGLLYAIPSGISATQFTRWHLDHHAELGSSEDDPKRHHLSPKINARWFKLLYCTPALFPIYFQAARREAATYPPEVRATIARERRAAIAAHLAVLAAIWVLAGGGAALRAYIVPVFFVFPVAFTLNRLGQHYDIDPDDPAKWTTLVRGSRFWNAVYLNSNFHLEHHYFPGVPLYHLPALQRLLEPFYRQRGIPSRTYSQLLKGWLLDNRAPHTRWERTEQAPAAQPPVAIR